MRLKIRDADLRLVAVAKHSLLLGLILDDGTIRLVRSDRSRRPGHAAWVKRDSIANVFRGFSLLVKNGLIVGPLCRFGV